MINFVKGFVLSRKVKSDEAHYRYSDPKIILTEIVSHFESAVYPCAYCYSCHRGESPIDSVNFWTEILITFWRRIE